LFTRYWTVSSSKNTSDLDEHVEIEEASGVEKTSPGEGKTAEYGRNSVLSLRWSK